MPGQKDERTDRRTDRPLLRDPSGVPVGVQKILIKCADFHLYLF